MDCAIAHTFAIPKRQGTDFVILEENFGRWRVLAHCPSTITGLNKKLSGVRTPPVLDRRGFGLTVSLIVMVHRIAWGNGVQFSRGSGVWGIQDFSNNANREFGALPNLAINRDEAFHHADQGMGDRQTQPRP